MLRAMCEAISRQRGEGIRPDFVLATGDVAYTGKAEDYRLAPGLFDAVSTASGVPKARIFCIPGNHDIDRDLADLEVVRSAECNLEILSSQS